MAESALLALYRDHHRAFLDFLERRVGDRGVAEDLLQEAFVRGLGQVDEDRFAAESILAWFYRTLRNAAIDHHRRQRSRGEALAAFAAEQPETPEPAFAAAICQCVRGLAGTLKPELAQALSRIDVDGVAVKDHAAEAGITPGNAAVRVLRARRALKERVAAACGICAEHGCRDCTCRAAG